MIHKGMFVINGAKILGRVLSILLVLELILLSSLYIRRNTGYGIDDSFITYRYASNLMEGYGLTFNVGEKHYGSTAMGYAIILGGISFSVKTILQLFGIPLTPQEIIPFVSTMLSGLSLFLIPIVWIRIFDIDKYGLLSIVNIGIFAIVLFTARFFNNFCGHETYFFIVSLLLGSFLLFFKRRILLSAIVMAVCTTIRPDAFLFWGILCVALSAYYVMDKNNILDNVIKNIFNYIIFYMVLLVPWILFTWLYFGNLIPETMIAKKAQVFIGYWPTFTFNDAIFKMLSGLPRPIIFLIIIGIPFMFYAMFKYSKLPAYTKTILFYSITWLAFAFFSIFFYSTFKVTFSEWYIIPAYFGMICCALSIIMQSISYLNLSINKLTVPKGAFVFVIIFGLLIYGTFDKKELAAWIQSNNSNTHIYSYNPLIKYIKNNEPNGTSIATAEPGALGFALGPKFHVVDELGLASPEVAKEIINHNFDYPFRRWNPKYVIVSWEGIYSPHTRDWFKGKYVFLREFKHEYWETRIGRGVHLYILREYNQKLS